MTVYMAANPEISGYRVEKSRSHATVTLTNGDTVLGCFFVAGSSAHTPGPELVGELLNAEEGFFPFEVHDRGSKRTVLFNRAQVITVTLAENEARQDSGYDVARPREIMLRLSNGRRLIGSVRVYRPEGRDRLSDWARNPDRFRYVESDQVTLIVNVAHVIEVSEVTPS
jgi:hypothetical protein